LKQATRKEKEIAMDWPIMGAASKLTHVKYDIRGAVQTAAQQLEQNGQPVLKLNIGNPAPFGFSAPSALLEEVREKLACSQGYGDAKGLASAREAVQAYYHGQGVNVTSIDNVYLGNGVSELIMMSMQALLDHGDEVLVPSPDYPLWTAAITLAGGQAVHYPCDEAAEWEPDIAALRAAISPRTKALVLINPNNPTGAVYRPAILKALLAVAREYRLMVFSDEIYDQILFEGAVHTPTASLAEDVLVATFGGLSKSHRIAGFRAGWLAFSGPLKHAQTYLTGLTLLASMRLCPNVPSQQAIAPALRWHKGMSGLTRNDGRLQQQMALAHNKLNAIDGISCVRPKGAMYLFPKLDIARFGIVDDEQFVLDFLRAKQILLMHGRGFNWAQPDHFRLVFLPEVTQLNTALDALADFLSTYQQ
jgi:alanine-synthesizing transaminase